MMKISIYGKPELRRYETFQYDLRNEYTGSNTDTRIAEILYKAPEGALIDIFMPVSVIQSFIDELQAKVDEEMEERENEMGE